MKLGLLTAALPGMSLAEIAPWAAETGYQMLEIACWPAGNFQHLVSGFGGPRSDFRERHARQSRRQQSKFHVISSPESFPYSIVTHRRSSALNLIASPSLSAYTPSAKVG